MSLIKNTFLYLIPIIFGYNFNYIQDLIGMYSLEKGVQYYAEAHLSKWNSIIHTLFMPGTMYGFFISIPYIFRLKKKGAFKLKSQISLFYIGLYSKISIIKTIYVMILYSYPFYISSDRYKKKIS